LSRPRRQYTLAFKQEAVRLVKEQGLTAAQVARDLGLDRSLVRSWLEKAAAGELVDRPAGAPAASRLEEEVRRLRKENAILREEREILKKAAAFFAKETR
jgi:transposase